MVLFKDTGRGAAARTARGGAAGGLAVPEPAERPPQRHAQEGSGVCAPRPLGGCRGRRAARRPRTASQSSTMSKVARKVGGMGWGSSAAHGNENKGGPEDLC